MQDHIVSVAKVGTVSSTFIAVLNDIVSSEKFISYVGLGATIMFGMLGLCATIYFKRREEKIRLAEFRQKFPDSALPL